jgi:Mg2+ and Co2+ transporter CorA
VHGAWQHPDGTINARQSEVVQLSVESSSQKTVAATSWSADRVGIPIDLSEHHADDIVWIDICPSLDESTAEAADLLEQIMPACPGLTRAMVHDLLVRDLAPTVVTYSAGEEPVRRVTVPAAVAFDRPDSLAPDGRSERVLIWTVKILVGDGWMVTCWHPGRELEAGLTREGEPTVRVLAESYVARVRASWSEHPETMRTSSDLGLALATELVRTYEGSQRAFERWTADWEVRVFGSLNGPERLDVLKGASREISNYLYLNAEIRRGLSSFMHGQLATSDEHWFPRVSHAPGETTPGAVTYLTESAYRVREDYERIATNIRVNMDALMLQLSAAEHDHAAKSQDMLELVSALILVPGLIVGFYGANTYLPGGGKPIGFVAMLALMVVGSAAVLALLRRRR